MPSYFDTGFCVRRPSWHGEENLLDEYPENWDAARMAAGLMWEPAYRDLFTERMVPVGAELPAGAVAVETLADGARRVMVPVEGHRAIVRDDTLDVLATPKDSFELIYHHQMGALLDSYTEAWRKAGARVLFETGQRRPPGPGAGQRQLASTRETPSGPPVQRPVGPPRRGADASGAGQP